MTSFFTIAGLGHERDAAQRPLIGVLRSVVSGALVIGCRTKSESAEPAVSASAYEVATVQAPRSKPSSSVGRCSVAGRVPAQAKGENRFEISRENLKTAIEAIQSHVRSGVKLAHVVASRAKDGRAGIRVFGIDPHATCGLRLSDLVLSVDHVPLTDHGALEQKRQPLMNADRIVLEIEREGVVRWLTYDVR